MPRALASRSRAAASSSLVELPLEQLVASLCILELELMLLGLVVVAQPVEGGLIARERAKIP